MDVHKAKPVHNLREFVSEVGIIILGVLIALAGEQAVEKMRWHEIVAVFEAAMTTELQTDDLPQAYVRVAMHPCLLRQLYEIDDAIDRNDDRPVISTLTRAYAPPWRSWDAEAWRAAEAAGATAHLSVERNLQWEGPYALMPLLQQQANREAEILPELQPGGHINGSLTAAERDRIHSAAEKLRQVGELLVRTSSLSILFAADAGVKLSARQKTEMLGQLRSEFGNCIITPAEPEPKKGDRHRLPG